MVDGATDVTDIVTRTKRVAGHLLGTFSDGNMAITVEPPEDLRKKTVNGLLVTINPFPRTTGRIKNVTGGAFYDEFIEMRATNFDRTNTKLVDFYNLIKVEFALYTAPLYIPASDLNYEFVILNISAPIFYLG